MKALTASRVLTLALLVLPASASVPTLEWNVHLVNRLRQQKRLAPEIGLDQYYRSLLPSLPPRGRIGFVYTTARSSEDLGRTHLFLQYALAPRLVVLSNDEDYVIVLGASGEPQLRDDAHYELVTDSGDGLRLFRRSR